MSLNNKNEDFMKVVWIGIFLTMNSKFSILVIIEFKI